MKGGWNEASRPNERRKVENKGISLRLRVCLHDESIEGRFQGRRKEERKEIGNDEEGQKKWGKEEKEEMKK